VSEHIKFTLYCDESGNTGGNFLDLSQPIYTLAGWLVPDDVCLQAERLVLDFEDRVKSSGKECKSRAILKTHEGAKEATALFRSLGRVGCLPMFSMAEKQYAVAAKIVETFLDPVHNNDVHPDFNRDTPAKQELAEMLMALPHDKLERFAMALRNADSNALAQSAKEIALYLKLTLYTELGEMIEGALRNIEEIAGLQQHSDSYLPNKAMQALNTPTAVQFFMMANDFGKRVGADILIVHDESFYYEDGLREVFTLHKEAREGSIALPHVTLSCGFKNLSAINFVKSEECPMVRAADIAAGAVTRYSSNVCRGLPISLSLVELASAILPGALSSVRLGWFMASGSLVGELFKPIVQANESPTNANTS